MNFSVFKYLSFDTLDKRITTCTTSLRTESRIYPNNNSPTTTIGERLSSEHRPVCRVRKWLLYTATQHRAPYKLFDDNSQSFQSEASHALCLLVHDNNNNIEYILITVDADSKILGHKALLNGLDANILKLLTELLELSVVIELGSCMRCYLSSQTKAPRKFQHTVEQSTSPGKDGSNWVGASLLSLLVLSVVTSDSSVCCLSLDGSCWVHQYRGHETERTETLQEIRTCFYNKQHIPEQQYRIGHHHHNSYMPTRNHQVI